MANTPISGFSSGAPAQGTDEFVVARSGSNYKLTAADIATFLGNVSAIGYTIDGGGGVIATGIAGSGIVIPFACTITEWTLIADASGSIVIDIWKDSYANYPPTVADTITGSAKPTISSATKNQSSTLTGWTTSIAAGDILHFNVDSCSVIKTAVLSLRVTR